MEKEYFEVLWFDDISTPSFIFNAERENIKITPAENLDMGLKLISQGYLYDAFIFDVNYKLKREDEPSLVVTDVIKTVCEISEKKFKKNIPWFVLSAGDYEGKEFIKKMIETSDWEKELKTKKFYDKENDTECLFENIKRTVRYLNSPEWAIKNKFRNVFEIFDVKNEFSALDNTEKNMLMELLISIEKNESSSNPNHLINMRKFVAGGVMKTLTNMGVIPLSIDNTNSKSSHLGNKKFIESIPIHVQRAFHSIISTCQDGAHSNKEFVDERIPPQIDKLVKEGNAPYLLYSLVYELLNIQFWLKGFMESHKNKEQNLIYFKVENSDYKNDSNEQKEITQHDIFLKSGKVSIRSGEKHAFLIVNEKERYFISHDLVAKHLLTNEKVIECEIGLGLNKNTNKENNMVLKIIEEIHSN